MKKNIIAISLMAAGLFTFGNVYALDNECSKSPYTEVCEETISEDEKNVTITLKDDLEPTGTIEIKEGKNVTFDLNGNDLTIDNQNSPLIKLTKGSLTIKDSVGGGTVLNKKGIAIEIAESEKKSVNIGKNVIVKTKGDTAAINLSTSTNTTLDVYGKVTSNGKVASETGATINVNGNQKVAISAPKIHIHDGAIIENDNSMAMYLAGYANTTIDAAELTGHTGIGIKSGVLTLNNTTITAKGKAAEAEVKTNEMVDTGAAIAVEDNAAYKVDSTKQTVIININGGTYTSKHNSVFIEYGASDSVDPALEELTIKNATFDSGASDKEVVDLPSESELENFISGGKFIGGRGLKFQKYLAEGLKVADDGTIVDPLAPTNPEEQQNPEGQGNTQDPTPDTTLDDSPQTYDGIMSYVTMALTSVGAVALSLKKVLSR